MFQPPGAAPKDQPQGSSHIFVACTQRQEPLPSLQVQQHAAAHAAGCSAPAGVQHLPGTGQDGRFAAAIWTATVVLKHFYFFLNRGGRSEEEKLG